MANSSGMVVLLKSIRSRGVPETNPRRDGGKRHNGRRKHLLAEQRIQQRALSAFELAENRQVELTAGEPISQSGKLGDIGVVCGAETGGSLDRLVKNWRQTFRGFVFGVDHLRLALRRWAGPRRRGDLAGPIMPIHQNDDVLHRDHPFLHHRFQMRQQQLDLLFRIDDLDDHGQVG